MKTKHRHKKNLKTKAKTKKKIKHLPPLWHGHIGAFSNGPEGLFATGRSIEACIDNLIDVINVNNAGKYWDQGPFYGPWTRDGTLIRIDDDHYNQPLWDVYGRSHNEYQNNFIAVITR